jgi:CelD/BcsL family acetyltransferase involved in cellulose biosynthesis
VSLEAPPAIEIELVTNRARLAQLTDGWTALWNESRNATPFQSPEWLQPWWNHYGNGQLRALFIRDGRQLIGMVPLFLPEREGSLTHRVLLLGTGLSDYLDGLCASGSEEICAAAMFDWLRDQEGWDICDFQQLRSDSFLFGARLPNGWTEDHEPADKCPVLNLAGASLDNPEFASPDLMHDVNYSRRRAALLGPTQIERARLNNFEELFAAFLRLHKARWNERGLPGVAEQNSAFYRDSAAGLLARGMLRLYAWRVAGRIIATFFGFTHRRRAYYYLGGFDPEFRRLSPGNVLVAHAIHEAIKEGATQFDFLRGDEAYKYRWGARDETTWRRLIFKLAEISED